MNILFSSRRAKVIYFTLLSFYKSFSEKTKMFCPECGEIYDSIKPCCPWCGAPKPKQAPKKPHRPVYAEAKTKSTENETKYITYTSRQKRNTAFETATHYIFSLFLFLVGVICITYSWIGIIPLSIAAIIFLDIFYSSKLVCEVKWYENKFVLCTSHDETSFFFDRAKPYKFGSYFFGKTAFVFRKRKQKFYIYEHEFPEVVKKLKEIYCAAPE